MYYRGRSRLFWVELFVAAKSWCVGHNVYLKPAQPGLPKGWETGGNCRTQRPGLVEILRTRNPLSDLF